MKKETLIAVKEAYKIEKELPNQNGEVCQLLVMICENAIKANYTSRPLMGKVYLDEDLKNYTIPLYLHQCQSPNLCSNCACICQQYI